MKIGKIRTPAQVAAAVEDQIFHKRSLTASQLADMIDARMGNVTPEELKIILRERQTIQADQYPYNRRRIGDFPQRDGTLKHKLPQGFRRREAGEWEQLKVETGLVGGEDTTDDIGLTALVYIVMNAAPFLRNDIMADNLGIELELLKVAMHELRLKDMISSEQPYTIRADIYDAIQKYSERNKGKKETL